MSPRSVLAVFLIPVVLSVALGSSVLAQILQEPGRELDMSPGSSSHGTGDAAEEAVRVDVTFHVAPDSIPARDRSTTVEFGLDWSGGALQSDAHSIEIMVHRSEYDCSDLEITVYDLNSLPKRAIADSDLPDGCVDMHLLIPVAGSETAGWYELAAEVKGSYSNPPISIQLALPG